MLTVHMNLQAQLRPSTGTYDQKESLWLTRGSQWPSDQDVPNFRGTTARFMAKCASISGQVCTSAYSRFSRAKPSRHTADIKPHNGVACFSSALGFDEDYLVTANDPTQPDCISQLRLLHYPAADNASGTWRAGAHTDIGCLTLLFQRDKQDGLEICTGRESHTGFDVGDSFTPISAHTGPIVVNIGDMLSTKKPQPHDSLPKHKKVAANSPLPHSDSGVVRRPSQVQLSPCTCQGNWLLAAAVLHRLL